jgi:anti-sigma regulatory factor (Ser/Thr protein kinase)
MGIIAIGGIACYNEGGTKRCQAREMSTYTLTVTSELDKLETIAAFIEQATRTMGMDAEDIYAMQLAVDEACTNVIDYAYQGRHGQPVTVECCEDDGRCMVVIRDHGRPFDPARIPSPDLHAPLSRRRIGGLGIYLMRKLMDDVRFHFDTVHGNELTLVKAIRPNNAGIDAHADSHDSDNHSHDEGGR